MTLLAAIQGMREAVKVAAEEPCFYEDDCPDFPEGTYPRHGRCDRCNWKRLLDNLRSAEALILDNSTGVAVMRALAIARTDAAEHATTVNDADNAVAVLRVLDPLLRGKP